MFLSKGDVCMLIGNNLRKIRNEKGLSIAQLAFEVGIESKQLIRIELGQINTSIFQIFRITYALEIQMYEVFLFSGI